MGYKGDLRIRSWSWAPYGCHAGQVDQEDQEYGGLYFNKQSVETGRIIYRTFCHTDQQQLGKLLLFYIDHPSTKSSSTKLSEE